MISVVIPCYNAAATIAETIESALAQDVDKEIIVVDDGSTDASQAALAAFGPRIRSVATENRGASAARDTGTALATGAFIQYLDSDDLLTPGTLATRLAALEDSGADVAHTDWRRFSIGADGATVDGPVVKPDVADIAADAEAATASGRFWAPPAALLYRRSAVERIGGWHPSLPVIQDARFLFDIAASGALFVHAPGVGARYRVSADSLSRRNVGRFVADCAFNAREIEALWRARSALSAGRERALAQMWTHVAAAALDHGLDDFALARQGYNRAARRRVLFEAGAVLRSLIGPRATAAALAAARRAKAAMLGRRATSENG